VLIDDLVTKGTEEPYRMFTSRAEYRLLLRQDNADRRLMRYGHRFGLISDEQLKRLEEKERQIAETIEYLRTHRHGQKTLEEFLRRPEKKFDDVVKIAPEMERICPDPKAREQVEIEIKYAGYIERQKLQIERFRKMESWRIPDDIDYFSIKDLRLEAREKLSAIRPISLGQASRISGVSPADISILMVYLMSRRRPADKRRRQEQPAG